MNKNSKKIPLKVFAAVVATGLMSFSGVLVETSMNIAFPTLMRDFNVSTNVVQWMTSIYLLAVSIIVPISATLKSSYKTKNLFLTANILFLIGLVIDALAPAFPILLLGRVIQGIGTGIALPLMFNIILEQVPKKNRNHDGCGEHDHWDCSSLRTNFWRNSIAGSQLALGFLVLNSVDCHIAVIRYLGN